MARLEENLDYTFNWKDLIVVDKLMKNYINDREIMFNNLFNSSENFEKEDISQYIEFFMGANASDMDIDAKEKTHHKNLYNIRHFLQRKYEFSLLPSYYEQTDSILSCLSYFGVNAEEMTESDISLFIEDENECISMLKGLWEQLLNEMASYPMLHLEKLKKTSIMGSTVYYDKNTDKFVLENFTEFLQNVKHDFPDLLKRFDRFLILDNEYLKFLACDEEEQGETQAFFTDDSIFLKCHCDDLKDESEKFFYKEVLYHEFGHFIFEQLPQYLQLYWQEQYSEWRKKGLKMPRDEERNSQLDVYCEECFADNCAIFYLGDEMSDEDYIHTCNEMIQDTFSFIVKKAFEK